MTAAPSQLTNQLHALFWSQHHRTVADGPLLRSFAGQRDGDAFTTLLHRHGPMVLALARRIVRDQQRAEDVCQATFLVLARKASSLRRPAMPPHAMRERIVQRWFEIRKGKEREPERAEDYEALHHDFPQHTFATLYAVVHEFDE